MIELCSFLSYERLYNFEIHVVLKLEPQFSTDTGPSRGSAGRLFQSVSCVNVVKWFLWFDIFVTRDAKNRKKKSYGSFWWKIFCRRHDKKNEWTLWRFMEQQQYETMFSSFVCDFNKRVERRNKVPYKKKLT